MKLTLLLMLLGLAVLSCKKETKVDTSHTSDSVITDTVPADSMGAPMPSDTLPMTDTTGVKKTDTAKVTKK
ncbi:hypothetical protein [Chryseobacterium vrystaatense]|nr:hypothetical protein [Chryseobacterium vrystaatense]